MSLFFGVALFFYGVVLAYQRASLAVWSTTATIVLLMFTLNSELPWAVLGLYWLILMGVLLPFNITSIRRQWLSRPFLAWYRRVQPSLSKTEQEALEAGSVSWDGALFSGAPDWYELVDLKIPALTAEEQAFLDGPVEKLCQQIDDWEITHERADLPPALWRFLKKEGFFGLIIPKEYGGKGFSANLHAAVIQKIASKSSSVSSTVTVPNSLGPAELLLHYGTKEQKEHYLPRLAKGLDIPCFALTGPENGSDAGAMPDSGVVCRGEFEGKPVVGIRLNWNKRYITLAPVATVIGVAFKLYDPEHLIGEQDYVGISCALVPASLPGVVHGRRHYPLNIAFQNGPTQGKDVFIPVDYLIGGVAQAGKGWRMLVECLATGRGITLPATASGASKMLSAACGSYARIRRQFNCAIGQFEGIKETLARIGGLSYIIQATQRFTVGLIENVGKPAVPTAIAKYHTTELLRQVGNDAMDLHGGKGICLGPANYLGRHYQAIPITITVEGANILTRCMIIFGQGLIRCHPFVLETMEAAQHPNKSQRLRRFDKAMLGHINYFISNLARSLLLGLTSSRIVKVPMKHTRRYYQHFSRFSAVLALLSDVAMIVYGPALKRKESNSARLGDLFSALYLGSAVLKHYEDHGQQQGDLPLVEWSCQYLLHRAQQSVLAILANFPNRILANILRVWIFPLGCHFEAPADELAHCVADCLMEPSETRSRLVEGIFLNQEGEDPFSMQELALEKMIAAEPLYKRLHEAVKQGTINASSFNERLQQAHESKLLTSDEMECLQQAEELRLATIAVDDFDPAELAHRKKKKAAT